MKTTQDYSEQIAEFWPTIMQAWEEHSSKRPVIECHIVERLVIAWPAREYIDGLSARTRAATRRQFERASAKHGIMVCVRDNRREVLQSYVFLPEGAPKRKPNRTPRTRR